MPADVRKEGFLVEFQPMSPEEMQRMMQFLLNQQAQFDADLAKSQERFDAGMERLSGGLTGLTAIVGQLALSQQLTAEQLRQAGEQIKETGIQLRETDAQLRETDTRLNRLGQMFDRHLREDHGHSPA
jgi:uncharacterized protein with von Willebrand factor type A (vWA) domain